MRKNKLTTWVLVVLIIFATLVCGCTNKPEPKTLSDYTLPSLNDNQFVVVIVDTDNIVTDYVVTFNSTITAESTVEQVVNYLHANNNLDVEWVDGAYGKYINSIGGALPTEANEYVSVYTSVTQDMDVSAYASSLVVSDTTVTTSGVGVSSCHVQSGCVILFKVETF